MHLQVANTLWLLAAAILVIGGVVALVLTGRRSRRWKWACVICPALSGLAIALALAGLALQWSPQAGRTVILLDLSASTRTSPWRDPQWVQSFALQHLRPGMRVTVVGFADQSQVLIDDAAANEGGRWPVEWPALSGGGTDVARALAWRSTAEARGGALAPRWLITDGLVDAGEAASGYELAVTALPPRTVDAGIAELRLKGATPGSTAAELWVRVRATGAMQGDVELLRDAQLLARQPVRFTAAAERWVSLRMNSLPTDRPVRLTARLVRSAGDPWPENDAGSLLYVAEGPPRVLVVGEDAKRVTAGLAEAGLRTGSVGVGGLPPDAVTLVEQGWQVVVLDNVSMKGAEKTVPLTPAAALMLEQFVQQTGGGLVLSGGQRAFGPGAYPEGVLEKLSPLASQPPERPGANVIFLLDCSASMNEAGGGAPGLTDRKIALVARGVESALELLQNRDTISVVTFNSDAALVVSGNKKEVEKGLGSKLAELRPQGTTTPDTALEIVRSLVPPTPEREGAGRMTMLVLLTDGEIPKMNVKAWGELLKKSGTLLTVVAPTPGALGTLGVGQDVLPVLAKENSATWLALDDAGGWTALLRRAVAERLMGRARTTTIDWNSEFGNQNSELKGTTSRWIETYLKAEAKSRAITQSPDPGAKTPAAIARRGLGQVAALAMDADAAESRALLAKLVREAAPSAGDRRFTLTARREAGGWRLRADGHDERGFLNNLQLHATILTPTDSRSVDLPQTAPGTYEVQLSAAVDGPFAAIVTRSSQPNDVLVGTLRPANVQTDEYPASVESTALPQDATVLPADDKSQWSPRLAGWSLSMAPSFWLLAAIFATAALWLRRGH